VEIAMYNEIEVAHRKKISEETTILRRKVIMNLRTEMHFY
jgi:hypothetical protein